MGGHTAPYSKRQASLILPEIKRLLDQTEQDAAHRDCGNYVANAQIDSDILYIG